jgi:hypothetical protein
MYSNARRILDPATNRLLDFLVDINGVTHSIPTDPANTDYQRIMALVAEGKLVIAPSETP